MAIAFSSEKEGEFTTNLVIQAENGQRLSMGWFKSLGLAEDYALMLISKNQRTKSEFYVIDPLGNEERVENDN